VHSGIRKERWERSWGSVSEARVGGDMRRYGYMCGLRERKLVGCEQGAVSTRGFGGGVGGLARVEIGWFDLTRFSPRGCCDIFITLVFTCLR